MTDERTRRVARGRTWWTAVLFLVGSACFAAAAIPGLGSIVAADVLAAVFFVGSLFFTSAAFLQYLQAAGAPASLASGSRIPLGWTSARVDRLAAVVQLAGTLWFNVNTWDALTSARVPGRENLRVWTPDVIGSFCFLVASGLALGEVRYLQRRRGQVDRGGKAERSGQRDRPWSIAVVNEVGSVLFMVAALAAFVRPDTTEPVAAGIANGATCLGALCFLWGARLLLPPRRREMRGTGPGAVDLR